MLCHTQSNCATYMMPKVKGTSTPTNSRANSTVAWPDRVRSPAKLRSAIGHLHARDQGEGLKRREWNDRLDWITGRARHGDEIRCASSGALVATGDIARADGQISRDIDPFGLNHKHVRSQVR